MFLFLGWYPKNGNPVFVLSEGPFHDCVIFVFFREGKKLIRDFFKNFSILLGPSKDLITLLLN